LRSSREGEFNRLNSKQKEQKNGPKFGGLKKFGFSRLNSIFFKNLGSVS